MLTRSLGGTVSMSKFRLYDVVQVVQVPQDLSSLGPATRPPRVGDTGTIVMAYDSPSEGYTVEAVATDGCTEWLMDFRPQDLERVA
jgi:hypothetical protein